MGNELLSFYNDIAEMEKETKPAECVPEVLPTIAPPKKNKKKSDQKQDIMKQMKKMTKVHITQYTYADTFLS